MRPKDGVKKGTRSWPMGRNGQKWTRNGHDNEYIGLSSEVGEGIMASPSTGANSWSLTQTGLLWNLAVHYRVRKRPPLVSVLLPVNLGSILAFINLRIYSWVFPNCLKVS
jgi:hypothetical protein